MSASKPHIVATAPLRMSSGHTQFSSHPDVQVMMQPSSCAMSRALIRLESKRLDGSSTSKSEPSEHGAAAQVLQSFSFCTC